MTKRIIEALKTAALVLVVIVGILGSALMLVGIIILGYHLGGNVGAVVGVFVVLFFLMFLGALLEGSA